jgi:CheY-like chemotaxis protein
MKKQKQLGDLLVEAGIITSVTIERALERQKNRGVRLGEVLEEMGVITQEELIKSLSLQFGFQRVSQIVTHQFSKSLLDLVPSEIALISLVFPLKVLEGCLYLAMYDPFDSETLEILVKRNNLKVVPILATRDAIMEAISYYYKETPAGFGPSLKVLVVDDDPKDAQIIELSLMNEGFNIYKTNDTLKAFSMAVELLPDLIICDSAMPRHDGFEFLNELRADFRTEQIPFIMLTSADTAEDERKAVESDCIDYIPKPLIPARIIARVKRALRFAKCIKEFEISY